MSQTRGFHSPRYRYNKYKVTGTLISGGTMDGWQAMMELSLKIHGVKAGVLAHSFGDTIFRYFLSWVESPHGGNAVRPPDPLLTPS
eukprot:334509-Prorocentrum_minimum.AAC.1